MQDELLNNALLDELESQIGRSNLLSVIETFQQEFSVLWEQLTYASQEDNEAQIEKHAHSLSGICRTLGLIKMGDAMANVENTLRSDNCLPEGWMKDLEIRKTKSLLALCNAAETR